MRLIVCVLIIFSKVFYVYICYRYDWIKSFFNYTNYLVIHENGDAYKSIPITSQLQFNQNGKTIEFGEFNIVFASGSACEDLFDELNDIVDELKKKEENKITNVSEPELEKLEDIQPEIVPTVTNSGFQVPSFGAVAQPTFGGTIIYFYIEQYVFVF